MKIGFWGNFRPNHSTETHVAASLESLGHEVTRLQEGEVGALEVVSSVDMAEADILLWVQTYSLAHDGSTNAERFEMLAALRRRGVPSVGFHLDRWLGLEREDQVDTEPFFRVDMLFTADGGHPDEWAARGVNHVWSPPAVFGAECYDAQPSRAYRGIDVAFLGSWKGYGHPAWEPYRMELLERCRARYGRRFACFPRGRALRGRALNEFYASVPVTIGDSCLAGGITRYWSDRTPECIGRGGFLVHPQVEGYSEVHPYVPTYRLGDFDGLFEQVDHFLAHPDEREALRRTAAEDVRANHTYANRMQSVLETVQAHQPETA